MPFCPECRSEYQDFVDRCADCEVALVAELPPEETETTRWCEFIDVYAVNDFLEAEAIKVLLEREELTIFVKDMHISALPMSVGSNAQYIIEVEQQHVLKALALIDEAIRDEYISKQGSFLTEST